MTEPYYDLGGIEIYNTDAMGLLSQIDDGSIGLIVTDPPYYKVKGEWWDRQWDTPAEFLAWIGRLCDEFKRVLKPNGSLYVFASPQMCDGVKAEVARRFNVLNTIRWYKNDGTFSRADMTLYRTYCKTWEGIIFAEPCGCDLCYKWNCDGLHGFIYENLRTYLANEWERAGLTKIDANIACGFSPTAGGMASRHYFSQSQWQLPTREHYHALRTYANNHGHGDDYLRREYEDLRREYEDLRREYEDLRRAFYPTAETFRDVWFYAQVESFNGKHPTEKPLPMLEDIVRTSSREGDTVADFFMGRGASAVAARNLGRQFIGCDIMEKWCKATVERLSQMPMLSLIQSTEQTLQPTQFELQIEEAKP